MNPRIRCLLFGHVVLTPHPNPRGESVVSRPYVNLKSGVFRQEWCARCGVGYLILPKTA